MPEANPPTIEIKPTRSAARHRAERACGDCRICCKLPDIPELNKPRDTWCRHTSLRDGTPGCSIYDDRPGVCREFRCAWLDGLGTDRDRPDKLGVMWQPIRVPDGTAEGAPGLAFVETRPGALQEPRVRALLAEFTARKPGQIVVRRSGHPRFEAVPMTLERRAIDAKPASVIESKPSGPVSSPAGLLGSAGLPK